MLLLHRCAQNSRPCYWVITREPQLYQQETAVSELPDLCCCWILQIIAALVGELAEMTGFTVLPVKTRVQETLSAAGDVDKLNRVITMN